MGFALGIFPILAVMGLFKLRRSGGSDFRMPGFPMVPVLFAGVSLFMLVLAYLERPMESSIAVLMVGVGIPFYLFFSRARKMDPARGGVPLK
jgi:APA family basic amino acid/polyamine antiporter